jgi:predicted HTH transcriptional regulator
MVPEITIDNQNKGSYTLCMIRHSGETIPIDVFEEIVTLGEGYKTEFHATLPSPASVAKTLCAFANTKGGSIFVGINESSVPVGVIDRNFEIKRLEKAIPFLIPELDITVKTITFKSNEILFIEVKEGNNKPYYVRNGQKTQAYLRVGDVNIPATKKTLKTTLDRHSALHYGEKALKMDERIVYNLFEREHRLSLEKLKENLHFSERRLRKILVHLEKRGLVRSSDREKNTYLKSKVF